jgi:hypothetical protein
MSIDPIKKHLNGFAATLAALDLIRRGVAPSEAAEQLLVELAGTDCLAAFGDKELRSLANKMSRAAQNMAKVVHAVHGVFAEALEVNGVLQPASRTPNKTSLERRREYMKHFMRNKRAADRANATAPADR